MIPPTVTHQEKQVHVVKGKPVFYEPQELKAARQKLMGHLAQHCPTEPFQQGVRLIANGVFLKAAATQMGVQDYEARYGQSAEAFKGLHDSLWILEG